MAQASKSKEAEYQLTSLSPPQVYNQEQEFVDVPLADEHPVQNVVITVWRTCIFIVTFSYKYQSQTVNYKSIIKTKEYVPYRRYPTWKVKIQQALETLQLATIQDTIEINYDGQSVIFSRTELPIKTVTVTKCKDQTYRIRAECGFGMVFTAMSKIPSGLGESFFVQSISHDIEKKKYIPVTLDHSYSMLGQKTECKFNKAEKMRHIVFYLVNNKQKDKQQDKQKDEYHVDVIYDDCLYSGKIPMEQLTRAAGDIPISKGFEEAKYHSVGANTLVIDFCGSPFTLSYYQQPYVTCCARMSCYFTDGSEYGKTYNTRDVY